jgi:hypothetical protein
MHAWLSQLLQALVLLMDVGSRQLQNPFENQAVTCSTHRFCAAACLLACTAAAVALALSSLIFYMFSCSAAATDLAASMPAGGPP